MTGATGSVIPDGTNVAVLCGLTNPGITVAARNGQLIGFARSMNARRTAIWKAQFVSHQSKFFLFCVYVMCQPDSLT
jgi:hypothetical protein